MPRRCYEIPIVWPNCLPSCRAKQSERGTGPVMRADGCRPLSVARLLAGSDNVAVIEVAMFKAPNKKSLKLLDRHEAHPCSARGTGDTPPSHTGHTVCARVQNTNLAPRPVCPNVSQYFITNFRYMCEYNRPTQFEKKNNNSRIGYKHTLCA